MDSLLVEWLRADSRGDSAARKRATKAIAAKLAEALGDDRPQPAREGEKP